MIGSKPDRPNRPRTLPALPKAPEPLAAPLAAPRPLPPEATARARFPELAPPDGDGAGQPLFSFDNFMELLGQTRNYILLACLAVGVLVFLFARQDALVEPRFTSSTDVEILPGEMQLEFARKAIGGTRDAQTITIARSLSEELMSDAVLGRAVALAFDGTTQAAQSADDDAGNGGGRLHRLISWLNYGDLPETATDPLAHYRRAIDVGSVDGSFIIRISATLETPERAAKLANAVFAAYSELQRTEAEQANAAIRAAYATRLAAARAELGTLIARELVLDNLVTAKEVAAANAPPEIVAELRANLQGQDSIVRELASLRSEMVNREIENTHLGTQTNILRTAQPATTPDGAPPLLKGVAYAVALFVFLIGCLIAATAGIELIDRLSSRKPHRP